MKTITENTKVSLALLIVILGGVSWLTKIYYMAEGTAQAMMKVQEKQDKYSEDIAKIKEDIAAIRGKVESL